jgi:hypothetical protein
MLGEPVEVGFDRYDCQLLKNLHSTHCEVEDGPRSSALTPTYSVMAFNGAESLVSSSISK